MPKLHCSTARTILLEFLEFDQKRIQIEVETKNDGAGFYSPYVTVYKEEEADTQTVQRETEILICICTYTCFCAHICAPQLGINRASKPYFSFVLALI